MEQSETMPITTERGRLGVISFALAIGVTAAIYVFLLGVAAGLFGWGWVVVEVLSSMFIGFSATFVGSIAGAVWAFVDGFVAGWVIAVVYNFALRQRR